MSKEPENVDNASTICQDGGIMPDKKIMPLIDVLEVVKPLLSPEQYEKYKNDPETFQIHFCECFAIRDKQHDADQKWSDARLEAREKEWRKDEIEILKQRICFDLAGHAYMTISDYSTHVAEPRNPAPEVSDDKTDPRD